MTHIQQKNINYLLKKYGNKKAPDEIWKSETEVQYVRDYRIQKKITIAINIMDRLEVVGIQRKKVKKLIEIINFNELCRNCSKETIIMALIFYVRKLDNSDLKISTCTLCKEYDLTENRYITIITNLCGGIQKTNPLWSNRRIE